MGNDPPHGADPGGVPPPGGEAAHRKTPKDVTGWGMGLPSDRGGPSGVRDRGDRGLYWG